MPPTNYEAFEKWAREQLANGPIAYEDLHAAASRDGFLLHLEHLRVMPDVKFRVSVDSSGLVDHTVELISPEMPF